MPKKQEPKKKTTKKASSKAKKKEVKSKEKKLVKQKEEREKEKNKIEKKKEEKKQEKAIWTSAKRKTARARVKMVIGEKGGIFINKKPKEEYFCIKELQDVVSHPFKVIGRQEKDFSFIVEVKGGGITGQAEAARRAISLALSYFNQDWRAPLKKAGFLTSDARIKERKKPGLKRARRAPQWGKR